MAERGNTIDDAGIRRLNEMSRQLGKRHPRTTHGRRRQAPVINGPWKYGRAVLDADLVNGGSASATFKKWNGSAWVDYSPTRQETVRCLFALTETITAGKAVFVVYLFGLWWVASAEC